MKIAHLICPMKLYGKEKWLLALLRHLDRSRCASLVIPLIDAESFPLADVLRRYGIEYRTVMVSGRFSYRGIREIVGFVKSEGIDILHSHDYKSDLFALAARCGVRVKLVSTPHGWSNERDAKLQCYQILDQMALGMFDHVVPLSTHVDKSLKFVRRARRTMIKNFIDVTDIAVTDTVDETLVSYVGRLTALKRVEDAIAALAYTKDPALRLQVIGDGPLADDLRRLATRLGVEKRVSFLGFRSDALPLLGASAALVLPSLTEGTSRILMEAMAMGKPVIGTDVRGINNLIEHDVTGILVPVKDPRSIARALDRVTADRVYSRSIGNAARDSIVKNRSAAVIVKEYERLYERVLSGARR